MDQIPLPSPVHYELLLQLLERQTMSAVGQNPALRQQVNQLSNKSTSKKFANFLLWK
jgi:hypothetical protein